METAHEFWSLFAQTGDPIAYVLYREACEKARPDVRKEGEQERPCSLM